MMDAPKNLGWSPYSYTWNNPVRYTDPTGMHGEDWVKSANGEIYWDENATSQATTKAGEAYLGKDFTTTSSSGLVTNFGDDGYFDHFDTDANTLPEVTVTGERLFSPDVKQLGLSGVITLGQGVLIEAGVAWDKQGNIGLYASYGLSYGVDASFGLDYNLSMSVDPNAPLNIYDLGGTGFTNTLGLGPVDFTEGGSTDRFFATYGKQNHIYTSKGWGLSGSPNGVGYSQSILNTIIIGEANTEF